MKICRAGAWTGSLNTVIVTPCPTKECVGLLWQIRMIRIRGSEYSIRGSEYRIGAFSQYICFSGNGPSTRNWAVVVFE
jgi:hypothetical protein